MSLTFVDGCSHYTTTVQSQRKGWIHSPGNVQALISYGNSGRFSGSSIRLYSNSGATTYTIYRNLTSNASTPYFGIAVYIDAQPSAGTYQYVEFRDGASSQIGIRINDNLTVSVVRGGSTVLGTSTKVITVGGWYQITAQFTVHGSSGIAKVWLDGDLQINLSGINTQATGNAYANRFYVVGGLSNTAYSLYFCDVYLGNGDGGTNLTPPIDSRVTTLFPTSSGTYNGWSYTGTIYAWQGLDDATPDDDASYSFSSVSGTVSTFVFGDLEADASAVYGAQISHYSRKDDAVTRATRGALYFSGTAKYFGDVQYLNATYAYYSHMLEYEPFASGTLTPSIINAIEPGLLVDT